MEPRFLRVGDNSPERQQLEIQRKTQTPSDDGDLGELRATAAKVQAAANAVSEAMGVLRPVTAFVEEFGVEQLFAALKEFRKVPNQVSQIQSSIGSLRDNVTAWTRTTSSQGTAVNDILLRSQVAGDSSLNVPTRPEELDLPSEDVQME